MGSIDEAIALTTAGNAILQDPKKVSTGIKTISMRLRGTSASELEEAGEDTEGVAENASKLYATIKKLTKTKDNPEGVSILTDTGAYKSTYEIKNVSMYSVSYTLWRCKINIA